nr:hypothetical protein Iba_chr14aCG15380 [Ipomoea batatas]
MRTSPVLLKCESSTAFWVVLIVSWSNIAKRESAFAKCEFSYNTRFAFRQLRLACHLFASDLESPQCHQTLLELVYIILFNHFKASILLPKIAQNWLVGYSPSPSISGSLACTKSPYEFSQRSTPRLLVLKPLSFAPMLPSPFATVHRAHATPPVASRNKPAPTEKPRLLTVAAMSLICHLSLAVAGGVPQPASRVLLSEQPPSPAAARTCNSYRRHSPRPPPHTPTPPVASRNSPPPTENPTSYP